MIIYKATNKKNGKCYIGQTEKNLHIRKMGHLNNARKESQYVFHNALRKYGSENFEWEVLCSCKTKEELDEMEFHYIKQYDSYYGHKKGYNMTLGGNAGWPGFEKGTKEYKDICEKISSGKKHSKCKSWNRGLTKETDKRVLNYSQKLIGRKHSKEAKKKMSKSAKERCKKKDYIDSFIKIMNSDKSKEKRKISLSKLFKDSGNPNYIEGIDKDVFIKLYKQGMFQENMAEYFNVGIGTIRRRIKEWNLSRKIKRGKVERKRDGENNPRWNKSIDNDKIWKMYKRGLKPYTIGKELGYPSSTVNRRIKYLKELGYEIGSKGNL